MRIGTRERKKVGALALLLLWGGFGLVHGASFIIVSDQIELAPDSPGQQVTLYLMNPGEPVTVAGLELNFQVGDGGPELSQFGGSVDGPKVTDVDIVGGTVFGDVTVHATTDHSFPQLWVESLHLDSGTVTIPTVTDRSLPFAQVTLDTSGFENAVPGLNLELLNTINGGTSFFDGFGNAVAVSEQAGGFPVALVPEPGVWVSCGLYALLAGWLVSRRKR